MVNKQTIISNI